MTVPLHDLRTLSPADLGGEWIEVSVIIENFAVERPRLLYKRHEAKQRNTGT